MFVWRERPRSHWDVDRARVPALRLARVTRTTARRNASTLCQNKILNGTAARTVELPRGLAMTAGSESDEVSREAGFRFMPEEHGEAEESAQPATDGRRRIEGRTGRARRHLLPKAAFSHVTVERAAQHMDPRGALAIHCLALLIENGVGAVVLQNAPGVIVDSATLNPSSDLMG